MTATVVKSGIFPGPQPIAWTFSDRSGGVSSGPFQSLNLADHVGDDPDLVSVNRDRFAQRLGLTGADLAILVAAHGVDVHRASGPGPAQGADIVITRSHEIGLVALAADCVMIALGDPRAGVAAAVHSGWRGVAANAAGAAVAAMVAEGADPNAISAVLGPSACPSCYEVSPEVSDAIAAASRDTARTTTSWGTPSVDLHNAITQQLAAAGVHRIDRDPTCSIESPELFSYRRDGRTGRYGLLVRIQEPAHE